MHHQIVFAAVVAAVCVAVTLGQGDDAPAPCVLAPYIAPGLDTIRFKEMISYHDTVNSKTLYVTDATLGEYVLMDMIDGKAYESYADGSCSWFQIGDDDFDYIASIAAGKQTVSIEGVYPTPIAGYEITQGDTRLTSLQRTDECSGLWFGLSKNNVQRLLYWYTDERLATTCDLQPIYDAVKRFEGANCEER